MKKFLNIITVSIFVLTLTGCGHSNPKITCTNDTTKIIVNYEKDQIVKQHTEITQKYENNAFIDMAFKNTQATADAYNDITGISAETTKKDNSIILKITYDYKNMSEESIKEIEINKNPKDFVKEYENNGFTCKIK